MFCSDIGVLQVFLIIRKVIDIVKIAIPIGLIVMVMLDFAKGAVSDEKGGKEASGKAMKRIVAAVLIFFIPFIINLVIDIINESLHDETNYSEYKVNLTDCWVNATQQRVNNYNNCLKNNNGNSEYCVCMLNSSSPTECVGYKPSTD